MVLVRPKPRYSEQIESGVFCFVAPGNTHGKRYAVRSEIETKPLTVTK